MSATSSFTLPVGGVVSTSMAVYFRNLVPMIVLTVVLMFPWIVARLWFETDQSNIPLAVGTALLQLVLAQVLTGAITYGVVQHLNGERIGLQQAVNVGVRSFWAAAVTGFVWGLLVTIGFVLLVVPGIIVATWLYPVVPVAVVERTGISGSFGRALELTKGSRWQVFGALLLLGVVFLFVFVLPMTIAAMATGIQQSPPVWFDIGLTILITPFMATFPAVVYSMLRRRQGERGPEAAVGRVRVIEASDAARYAAPMRRLLLALLLPFAALPAQQPKDTTAALTPDQVARADAIHARVLTLDTHKDIDKKLAPESLPDDPATRERFEKLYDPTVRGDAQVDFPKMREGGYDCAFFIVYTDQGKLTPAGYARALAEANAKFDAIHRMVRLHGDTIGLATTPDEVERLHRDGKLIACIGIENGFPMGEDLGRIATFHQRGARYMSITHNGHTQLGDSHTPEQGVHGGPQRTRPARDRRDEPRRDHGRRLARREVDDAAGGRDEPGAGDRVALGCARRQRPLAQLDDEQLRALAKKGGVVQCVALGEFVRSSPGRSAALKTLMDECGVGRDSPDLGSIDDDERERRWAKVREGMPAIDAKFPKANVRDFADHVAHVVKVAGVDHVGIGSDFDGGGGIVGWEDASESRNVTREFVRRGYTEEQIAKIWSGNLLRVWREVERVAAASR